MVGTTPNLAYLRGLAAQEAVLSQLACWVEAQSRLVQMLAWCLAPQSLEFLKPEACCLANLPNDPL
jgi:hypothetical protein